MILYYAPLKNLVNTLTKKLKIKNLYKKPYLNLQEM
jgi:hypothetical protein